MAYGKVTVRAERRVSRHMSQRRAQSKADGLTRLYKHHWYRGQRDVVKVYGVRSGRFFYRVVCVEYPNASTKPDCHGCGGSGVYMLELCPVCKGQRF